MAEAERITDSSTTFDIAITGASGLVGSALCKSLTGDGKTILRLTRNASGAPQPELEWDAKSGISDPGRLNGVGAVVHLAGESIADGRWSEAKKRRIRDSRIDGTQTLVGALTQLEKKPAVLVCASAIGYYGDRGDEGLDESSPPGKGFLPDVCKAWEAATGPAAEAGIRVVNVRIGIVLSKDGGALASMLLPFKLGAGGRVGSGEQYWSWIHLDDVVGVIRHAIDSDSLAGPVNTVSPQPVTNAEFTKVLGNVLHRPTIMPMPAPLARLALGEMADDLLLASARVLPGKLQESGYRYRYTDLKGALSAELG